MSPHASLRPDENFVIADMKMQAALPPRLVRPIRDTREQLPWLFENLGIEVVDTLTVADYSFVGGKHYCRVERKSGEDYLSSIFTDRFGREMELIKAFPCHALIVECDWAWLESGAWKSRATPKSVIGKTIGFIESGVQVILAGNRERAQQIAERLIYMSARRLWERARELVGHVVTPDMLSAQELPQGEEARVA